MGSNPGFTGFRASLLSGWTCSGAAHFDRRRGRVSTNGNRRRRERRGVVQPAQPRAAHGVPFFQAPPGRMGSATIEIYAGGTLAQVSSSVQQELHLRLPAAQYEVRTLTRQVEASIRQERLLAKLASFFGILALALAVVGLYGLLAYMVARRTGEIGMRMALGAQEQQMLWLVLRDALRLVAIGVVLGVPVAWWASRFIEKMMFGLCATDRATILGAAAIPTGAARLARRSYGSSHRSEARWSSGRCTGVALESRPGPDAVAQNEGANPNRRPMTVPAAIVNPKTLQLRLRSSGMSRDPSETSLSRRRLPICARPTPAATPNDASNKLSVRSWRITRPLLAPMAMRRRSARPVQRRPSIPAKVFGTVCTIRTNPPLRAPRRAMTPGCSDSVWQGRAD